MVFGLALAILAPDPGGLAGAGCRAGVCSHGPSLRVAEGGAAVVAGCGDAWRVSLPAGLVAEIDRQVYGSSAQDGGDGAGLPPPAASTVAGSAVSKEEAALRRDIEADIAEGKKIAEMVEREMPLSEDEDAIARLQAIGAEMAEIANARPVSVLWGDRRHAQFPYSFRLLKGSDVNAFSLPGGTIYFYEGLLQFAESDDELAAVVAHEISHAAFRHMATLRREQSRLDLLNIPLLIAMALSGDAGVARAAMAAQLATQGLVSGWSVQAETSADFGAVQYMRQSRFNPVGMLTFMERLAHRDKLSPNLDWGIYRTHPPSEERARFLVKTLNEMGIPIRRSAVTTSLAARSLPREDGSFEMWFGDLRIHTFRGEGARDRAARAVVNMNAFLDTVPQTFQFSQSGGEMLGNGRLLFSVSAADVLEDQEIGVVSGEVAKSVRRSIFELGFRLWSAGR